MGKTYRSWDSRSPKYNKKRGKGGSRRGTRWAKDYDHRVYEPVRGSNENNENENENEEDYYDAQFSD